MKIAVTYDNGEIFGHFGHTEQFKVYDTDDNFILGSEVIDTNGAGHEALATFLQEKGIKVLICGGIGQGAVNALDEAGIEVVSGIEGSTDKAVEAYLLGELSSEGVNCSHHDEEEGACGGGCGGCHGCHSKPKFDGKNVGRKMSVHYKGTFDNGEQFDSSYDRGEPLSFVCGAGQMILGFDKAVADMEVGEEKDIHLLPAEAYGEKDPNAIFSVPINELPGAEDLIVGNQVYLQNVYGMPFAVVVTDKTETEITFDANHEMAGKSLNFHIEIVSIED